MRSVACALALLAAFVPAVATAAKVQSCSEASVDLTSLSMPPEKNTLPLYDGKVMGYNVDLLEPACCSLGVALVVPDEQEVAGNAVCFAVVGFSSIDITRARRSYDAGKGLLIELDTMNVTPEGTKGPVTPLRLRINLSDASVRIEP